MTDLIQLRKLVEEFKADGKKPLERYPGVTRVLSGTKDMTGLDAWRDRVGHEEADRIVAESKAIGSSLDKIFNDSLESVINQVPFEESLYENDVGYRLYGQLKPYLKRTQPVAVQMKVWSDHMKMMGYLDCLGLYDNVLTLIDCKNSKKEKREEYLEDYYLQCTAYSMMLYDMLGIKIKQMALFIARRDSPFPQIIVRDIKPFVPMVLGRVKNYYANIAQ
ncbi:exonuclease [Xanthomonas phage BUDD]|nr:exonuclease [Xanthomonas phage BUDD]